MPPGKLDRWALWLSGACLVHCLAISAALLLLPTLAGLLVSSETQMHWLFLTLALPVSAIALGSGFRHHRAWPRLMLGMVGLASMFVGVSHAAGREMEAPLTVLGVVLVVVAHVLNIRQAVGATSRA